MSITDDLILGYVDSNENLGAIVITDLDGTNSNYRTIPLSKIEFNINSFKRTENQRSNPDFFNSDMYHEDRNRKRIVGDQCGKTQKINEYNLDYIGTNLSVFLGNPILNLNVYECNFSSTKHIEYQNAYSRAEVLLDEYPHTYDDLLGSNSSVHLIQTSEDENMVLVDYTLFNEGKKLASSLTDARQVAIFSDTDVNWGTITFSDSVSYKKLNILISDISIKDQLCDDADIEVFFVPDMTNKYKHDEWINANPQHNLYAYYYPSLFYYNQGMVREFSNGDDWYNISVFWNNLEYLSNTGETLSDHNFILSGILYVIPLLPNLSRFEQIGYHQYPHQAFEITRATDVIPEFYKAGTTISISGYNNTQKITCNMTTNELYKNSKLEYRDTSNEVQTINVIPGQLFDFSLDGKHYSYTGENIRIAAYYNSIDDVETIYSEALCPTFDEYYDIKNVTITMSGVKYDESMSTNEVYEKVIFKTNDEQITKDLTSQNFRTVGDVQARVEFTLSPNDIDLLNYNRHYHPSPLNIWLIGIPYSAISNTNIKNTVMRIPENMVLNNREINRRWLDYPKVNTIAASGIVELCTGVENTPTSNGLVWYKTGPLTTYANPFEGTFTETDYTMNVMLDGGRWALFVIIEDASHNYTGYCVSNKKDFNLPTRNEFEV